jgi:DNA-binding response OmpR family regulator
MASILIVEADSLVAAHMARTLREAGHTSILVRDAHATLQELANRPDLVLLDLELPVPAREQILRELRSRLGMAQTPVLVLAGQGRAATCLQDSEMDGVADILVKPVSGAQLLEAVARALAPSHQPPDLAALRGLRERQGALIFRLINDGSDALALHVARRLSADRTAPKRRGATEALTWAEIAMWGAQEGLLDPEEARVLRFVPLAEPHNAQADCT